MSLESEEEKDLLVDLGFFLVWHRGEEWLFDSISNFKGLELSRLHASDIRFFGWHVCKPGYLPIPARNMALRKYKAGGRGDSRGVEYGELMGIRHSSLLSLLNIMAYV